MPRSLTSLAPALALALALPAAAQTDPLDGIRAGASVGDAAARAQGEQAFPVGKWPEGLVEVGGALWVAQSGDRSVARLDPATGKVTKTVKIGRLPVSMAQGPDGAVVVQVSTDKVLKQVDPKSGKVKVITKLPDGPERTVVVDGFAYVLLWKGDSSAGSSVLRVELASGKTTRSADTGDGAFGLAVGGDHVWVIRGGGQINVLEAATLKPVGVITAQGRPYSGAYGAGAAFCAGGRFVQRLSTEAVTAQAELSADVRALGVWDDVLAAQTTDGTIWLLDPTTLSTRMQLKAAAPYEAQGMIRHDGALYLTTHRSADGTDKGSVLRVPLP
ncbi:MAG: hypothetical protein R3F43_12185 [bacterium]